MLDRGGKSADGHCLLRRRCWIHNESFRQQTCVIMANISQCINGKCYCIFFPKHVPAFPSTSKKYVNIYIELILVYTDDLAYNGCILYQKLATIFPYTIIQRIVSITILQHMHYLYSASAYIDNVYELTKCIRIQEIE